MITVREQQQRPCIEFWRRDIHTTLVHLWMSMLQASHRLLTLDREMRVFFGLPRTDVSHFLVANDTDLSRMAEALPYPFRPARRLAELLGTGQPTDDEKAIATDANPRAVLELHILWTSYLNVVRSVLDRDERARVLCGLSQAETAALRGISIAALQKVAAAGPYCFSASESLRGQLQTRSTLTRRELVRRTATDLGVIARPTK